MKISDITDQASLDAYWAERATDDDGAAANEPEISVNGISVPVTVAEDGSWSAILPIPIHPAVHEVRVPVGYAQAVTPGMWTDETVRADQKRLTAQAEQIGRLICERDQLRREIEVVRELLSRLPGDEGSSGDTATVDVRGDIERTIDHLLNGRTTKDQRRGLNTATERADRVRPGDDAAVGRALR